MFEDALLALVLARKVAYLLDHELIAILRADLDNKSSGIDWLLTVGTIR